MAGSVVDTWKHNQKNDDSQYTSKLATSGTSDFTPSDSSDWMFEVDNVADMHTDFSADFRCMSVLDYN